MTEQLEHNTEESEVEHKLRYDLQMAQQEIREYAQQLQSARNQVQTASVRIAVLEEQRDSLTKQLTEANFNARIAQQNTLNDYNSVLQRERESFAIERAGHHQELTEVRAELAEVFEKFGLIKHKQKLSESEYSQIFDAATWLLNVASKFNGNIEKTLGTELDIASVIEASRKYPLLRTSHEKITNSKLKEIFNFID